MCDREAEDYPIRRGDRGRMSALRQAAGSVGAGAGGVVASGGEGPAEDAGLGLLDLPARSLFRAMVSAALGAQVALVGGAFGVRGGVVQVRVDGLGLAAGCGAGVGAGADQVLELAARGVALLGVPMVAGSLGDWLDSEMQGAHEVEELLRLPAEGSVP